MSELHEPPPGSLPSRFCDLASKPAKSQAEKFAVVCIGVLAMHPWYESMSPEEIYQALLSMAEKTFW